MIVEDMHTLFRFLRKEVEEPKFKRLLIARFNLLPELKRIIHHEIALVKSGKQGRIILKMNALQDLAMIDELYRASEAGVKSTSSCAESAVWCPENRSVVIFVLPALSTVFWNMPEYGISVIMEIRGCLSALPTG